MDRSLITTGLYLEGWRIVRHLGIARGTAVRSLSVLGVVGACIRRLFGGSVTLYSRWLEHAQEEALDRLVAQAEAMGANAIIGMHYESEISLGLCLALACGTAVVVEPLA